tara:strand:- start:394 stop:681 length:288 start_codon:yes stop_codon:yes gene_type:complete
MKFNPRNRHILLSDVPKMHDSDVPTILLPEEYTAQLNPFGVYKVEQYSGDCTKLSVDDVGKLVLVNESMVEKVNVDQGEFLLILENHIYGVLNAT